MARKWLTQEKRSNDELFDALVRNALEFVSTSIGHLQHKPKNAIVDLYTAVELFLKARLMKEHWTLVLSSPESGDLQKGIFSPSTWTQRSSASNRSSARRLVIMLLTTSERSVNTAIRSSTSHTQAWTIQARPRRG